MCRVKSPASYACNDSGYTNWPIVDEYNWCAEYKLHPKMLSESIEEHKFALSDRRVDLLLRGEYK